LCTRADIKWCYVLFYEHEPAIKTLHICIAISNAEGVKNMRHLNIFLLTSTHHHQWHQQRHQCDCHAAKLFYVNIYQNINSTKIEIQDTEKGVRWNSIRKSLTLHLLKKNKTSLKCVKCCWALGAVFLSLVENWRKFCIERILTDKEHTHFNEHAHGTCSLLLFPTYPG